MVDHHRPSLSIAPKLVSQTNDIVVIDHHRRSEEFPDKPVLVYIEPYTNQMKLNRLIKLKQRLC